MGYFNAAIGEVNMLYPDDARNSRLTAVTSLIFGGAQQFFSRDLLFKSLAKLFLNSVFTH
jgi:hypothetical protein